MAIQDKPTLKSYFETDDKPTESQFEDLIDSLAHVSDIPTVPTDRKSISITVEAGASPLHEIPASTWASLGSLRCGVTVRDADGWVQFYPNQFTPPEAPTKLVIDFGGTTTETKYIELT